MPREPLDARENLAKEGPCQVGFGEPQHEVPRMPNEPASREASMRKVGSSASRSASLVSSCPARRLEMDWRNRSASGRGAGAVDQGGAGEDADHVSSLTGMGGPSPGTTTRGDAGRRSSALASASFCQRGDLSRGESRTLVGGQSRYQGLSKRGTTESLALTIFQPSLSTPVMSEVSPMTNA
jgi:hypothetical protein